MNNQSVKVCGRLPARKTAIFSPLEGWEKGGGSKFRIYTQGMFRRFCEERGVGKNVITRWRPRIFAALREELAEYLQ